MTTSPMAPMGRSAIVYRQLKDGDIEAAVELLSRGFPERAPDYWRRALRRLGARDVPRDLPRYGYGLTDGGRLVGIVLLIFSLDEQGRTRCNTSSWYVEPPYRSYSGLMLSAPKRLEDLTIVNISAAPGTLATIEAQGFRRYVDGTFHAVAALAAPVRGARVRAVVASDAADAPLLARCAALGCLAFEVTLGAERHPFAFLPRRLLGDRLPGAQLVYCRDIGEFVRFAGPLGRTLLRHGLPCVMIDANGAVPGLIGRYFAGRRQKYFRGVVPPRLGDLTETELVLFGD